MLTERGRHWLSQFEAEHFELVRKLAGGLTLVSQSEFERALDAKIRAVAATYDGPVALYAARELPSGVDSLFDQVASNKGQLDAVGPGADLGSEARVAALIRGIVKSSKEEFVNHPDLETLRKRKVRGIIVVDDLLGSGNRVRLFLDSMWANPTIRSWWSRAQIRFSVAAYSATDVGRRHVARTRCILRANDEHAVDYVRPCPTLGEMPWSLELRSAIKSVCKQYGRRTQSYMTLGYRDTAAMLIFEHGCPNNVPAIFWAQGRSKSPWTPLFPNRSVLPLEKSAFPPEIVRMESRAAMIEVGQARLAEALTVGPKLVNADVIMLLALAEKGMRSLGTLAFITGLPRAECANLRERCVADGLLTPTYRLTPAGLAELRYGRTLSDRLRSVAEKGSEDYYPSSLRGAAEG
ncbi:phosphoribosyltransferase-like protein [Ralstonia pseudosolanacearum]